MQLGIWYSIVMHCFRPFARKAALDLLTDILNFLILRNMLVLLVF